MGKIVLKDRKFIVVYLIKRKTENGKITLFDGKQDSSVSGRAWPVMVYYIEVGFMQKIRQRSSLLLRRTKFLQFLAALANLHQDGLEIRLFCTLFFNSTWCKIANAARN